MSTSNIPSSQQLKEAVFELLGKVDCETITRKELTLDLESNHGWNLSTLKEVVKESLNEYFVELQNKINNEGNMQDVKEEEEEEEEEDSDVPDDEPVKKKAGGFSKPCQLSPPLAEFLGCDVLPRTEVVKRIWVHIKAHDLQNPSDRREILCDAQLEKVLKRKKVSMFQLNKILSPMMKSLADLQEGDGTEGRKKTVSVSAGSSASARPKKTSKVKVEAIKKTGKATPTKLKKDKKADTSAPRAANPNAFGGPVSLSAPLQQFLGAGSELARTEVTKLMWKYIKEKGLQNANNRKEILCDARLHSLFGVESFTMFQMATLLKPMLIKKEN